MNLLYQNGSLSKEIKVIFDLHLQPCVSYKVNRIIGLSDKNEMCTLYNQNSSCNETAYISPAPSFLPFDTHREKLNSVREFVKIKSWLFLIFSTCLQSLIIKFYNSTKSTDVPLNKVIHQVDRKWMAAAFNKFHGKIWDGFCLNTRTRFENLRNTSLKKGTKDF